LREDLRAGGAADKPNGTRRERFLSRTQEAWQSTRPYHPSLITVSPDGMSLAFGLGTVLIAGPGNDLKEIDTSPTAGAMPNPVVRGRGGMVMPGGMPAVPSREDRVLVIEGVPAWSGDSASVYIARACGHLWRVDVASGGMERLALDGRSPVPTPDDKD